MVEIDGIVHADDPGEELKVTSARVTDDYIMLVTFSTGETRLCDFTELFDEVPAFEPLKDEKAFEDVAVVHGVPMWQNGSIDIFPTYLYDHSYEYESHGELVSV
ncbi:DUF2442 domain-containing protein [Bifidobacterium sp. ESL0763]|uniref:DUF2442 domain-containing protein n=1 Tax=Bifidobacterium sp. ESL0763 TaxID=2983227 RepID=UPI0023F9C006|nr:DUF2442 domain-containing protein [Bifidobacterium sp. ESL0763]MDF7664015.1 DUF2442 domain-containing protein [Bifidobacterium sp. ESL0763]